jgi:hypothetical protein
MTQRKRLHRRSTSATYEEFGYHTNFPSKYPSEEWRDCVVAVDVAALNRASETNEAEGDKFLIELAQHAQHIDRYGDAEGGGDFALERILSTSMRGRWRDHLMTGRYGGPSLHGTFLGRKIIRYFRSLLWKWEQLVGDGAHTPSKQGMDGSTRRIF